MFRISMQYFYFFKFLTKKLVYYFLLGFLRCLFNVSQKESAEASSELLSDEDEEQPPPPPAPEAVVVVFRGRGLFLESFFFLFLLSDRFISGDRNTRPSSTNVFWPFWSSTFTLFLEAEAEANDEAVVVIAVGLVVVAAASEVSLEVSFVNWHPGLLAVSRTGNQVTISGVRSWPGSSLRDFRGKFFADVLLSGCCSAVVDVTTGWWLQIKKKNFFS